MAVIFPQLQNISDILQKNPESFALGSESIRKGALDAAKFLFDLAVSSERSSNPHISQLLSSLEPSSAPQTRSQSIVANGKRKRTPSPLPSRPGLEFTPLTSLYVEGMNDQQVWAQLDLRAKHVCDTLELLLEGGPGVEQQDEDEVLDSDDDLLDHDEHLNGMLKALGNDEDIDFNIPEDIGEGDSDDDGLLSSEGEDDVDDPDDEEDLQEGVTDLRDPSSDMSDVELDSAPRQLGKTRFRKNSQLDDGFFNLASFNTETEEAEARSSSRGQLGGEDDSDDDAISIDLFATVDEEGSDDGDNAGEAMYGDFFAPPARMTVKKHQPKLSNGSKAAGQVRFHEEVRVKKIRAKGKNRPLFTTGDGDEQDDEYEDDSEDEDESGDKDESGEDENGDEDEDDEVAEEAMAEQTFDPGADVSFSDEDDGSADDFYDSRRETIDRLKNDLFDDEEENTPNHDLSTHEKRMAELQKQIADLESENVGPKDWVLMGEAGSRSRPQNSLLEEDLEVERAMKAVPVITEDTVLALEERIKARISENRFDDVVRIQPLDDKPFLPSRFFELKDTKSTQSLAQIYEDEYVASQAGGSASDDRDGKLKREHEEIEKLWEGICYKLDALCNSYFVPKQPTAAISTISNVSTTSLESALPTTKSFTTMLAPEEVFSPSTAEPRARSELTPAEKRTLRGRERKTRKKSRDALEKHVDKFAKVKGIGSVKRQKKAALESVIKSGKGVTVIGKPKKELAKNRAPGRR